MTSISVGGAVGMSVALVLLAGCASTSPSWREGGLWLETSFSPSPVRVAQPTQLHITIRMDERGGTSFETELLIPPSFEMHSSKYWNGTIHEGELLNHSYSLLPRAAGNWTLQINASFFGNPHEEWAQLPVTVSTAKEQSSRH